MEREIRRYGFLSSLGKEHGIVMPVAMVIMLLLTVVGLGALLSGSIDLLTTRSQREGKEAFYAAEGGIVYGTKELKDLLATTPAPSSAQLAAITAPSIPGFNFDAFSVVASGSATVVTVTSGPYAGLNSNSTPYTITVQASGANSDSGTVRLTQALQDQLIPLFQFGVYYNDDLEIFPGPPMFFEGRVHSNEDIYLGGKATVESGISSAGDIFRCRKDKPSSCNNPKIRTPSGGFTGLTYDHTHQDWATKAYNDWGGLVQDSAHGVQKLNLPIGTTDPRDLIKRGDTIKPADSSESQALKDSRMYWQAGLRIKDGNAYDKDGNVLDLTAGGTIPNPLSTVTFFDARESANIQVTQIDVDKLRLNSVAIAALKSPPAGKDPGILYVYNSGTKKGVRLVNGSTLPDTGLTVACENPIYVKGNYNTNNKKGAAILGDAVTFLSDKWNDADSTKALNKRVPSNTTVKAAVVTGNTETIGAKYNGGLENLPRFLEDWSAKPRKKLTFRGSLINLWRSQQATGAWKYGNPIYTAPERDWRYDKDFNDAAKLPPGTPRVRTLARAQWARQ